MQKCLVFGSLNIDHTYQVPHILNPKETLSAAGLHDGCGGKGLNQAMALSRAGVLVAMGGCLGQGSELLTLVLEQNHIDTHCLKEVSCPAGHAIIQVDEHGQNAILVYPGSNYCLSEEQIEDTLAEFKEGDLIVMQNEINLLPELIHRAHRRGLTLALNPSPVNEACHSLPLDLIDFLFINEVEGAAFCGSEDPQVILDTFRCRWPNCRLILTLGDRGSWYQDRSQRLHVNCCKVDVVDTVGAGDTFCGYFLAAILEGQTPDKCLKLATAASGCAVGRAGAVDSIPMREEAEALLHKQSGLLMLTSSD